MLPVPDTRAYTRWDSNPRRFANMALRSTTELRIHFVPRRGIEPRLPALQTGALPTELSWRKECFRYIHKPFVDWEGIEPSIQVCKTRVFPLALPAHFEIAVELNHDCPRLTIYPETISTSQKGIGIEPPSIIHTACQLSHQTICDVLLCRV